MNLSTRKFVPQLVVLLGMIGLMNLALVPLARSTYAAENLRRVETTPAATRTLFVGSSVVVEGIDAGVFDAASPPDAGPSMNVGMHSCTPAEQYQLFATAMKRAAAPRLMVWGFFGNELVRPVKFNFAEVVGTREMPFYAEADVAEPVIAMQRPIDRVLMRVVRPFPLLSERARLWSQVEKIRRKFDAIGLPPPPENKLGREEDMNRMAADAFLPDETNAYLTGREPFSPYVHRAVDMARTRGLRVVFVEMPLRSDRRRLSAESNERGRFDARLAQDLTGMGCEFVRCVDWVVDDTCFDDHVHLNERGAKLFSRMLARELGRPSASSPTEAISPGVSNTVR